VEWATPLSGSDLDKLHQFAQRLRRRGAMVVERQMDVFRQHPTGLHWVRAYHLQKKALNTQGILLKRLREVIEQIAGDGGE